MPSTEQTPRGIGILFSCLLSSPFILFGALTACFGGCELYQAHESMSWPAVDGQIQNSTVECCSQGDGGAYQATILYTFTVDGQIHRGNTVAFGDYVSSNRSHAQNIVNRYPKDRIVSVRYFVNDPDVCVLEPGIQGQTLLVPGLGLACLATGTATAVFFLRVTKEAPVDIEQ